MKPLECGECTCYESAAINAVSGVNCLAKALSLRKALLYHLIAVHTSSKALTAAGAAGTAQGRLFRDNFGKFFCSDAAHESMAGAALSIGRYMGR